MIAESVAFLVAAGQARRLRRRALLRRLRATTATTRCAACAAAADAGAETRRACATPTAARCPRRSPTAMAAVVGALGARRALGIHCHDDAGCGVANTLAGGRAAGATHGAGHDQRLRRALRQRQPGLDHRRTCSSSSGYDVPDAEQLGASSPRRRTSLDELLNLTPDPDQPYVGKQRLRPQGRACTWPGVNADPATFEHLDPALVGNRRELLVSELSGRGTVVEKARARRARRWTTTARVAGDRARQGARARGLPLRGGRRLASSCCCARRRAPTSRCSGSSPGA